MSKSNRYFNLRSSNILFSYEDEDIGRFSNLRWCNFNIKYQDIEIKQHSQVTYLGCVMDETMSGEPVARKVINKIN